MARREAVIRVEASRPTDWAELGRRWRALEPCCDGSFFQSWTWVGCLATTRFPDPLLLEAYDGARPVGLALFNRRRGRLHLNETGESVLDGLTVEHNGVLAARDCADAVRAACLAAARRVARAVVLSGIGQADLRAAEDVGRTFLQRTSPAPYVDLAAVRATRRSYLETLSSNTRYQIRRSDRRYEQDGPIVATRAQTVAAALAVFDELIGLHEARWAAEGKPGAFGHPIVRDFHRRLIQHGCERSETELWRVTAGTRTVGCLYNLRYREHVMSYQSGLSADATEHRKPGLTCHTHVIELCARDTALQTYDFLAGDHRYKLSLAMAAQNLHWVVMANAMSPERILYNFRGYRRFLKYHILARRVSTSA